MPVKTWAQLVRSGRALAGREAKAERLMSDIQWAWGDLAQEVCEFSADQVARRAWAASQGAEIPPHPLEVWRKEVGCPYSLGTLRNFRRTAKAWPQEKREPTACLMVHQILYKHQHLIQPGMTQKEANEAIGYKVPRKTYRISTDRIAAQLKKRDVLEALFTQHPDVKEMLEQELLRNLSLRQRIRIAA